MKPYVSPIDEQRARMVAQSRRFVLAPVKLYDGLVETFGQERADAIWWKACQLYDAMHADEVR